MKRTNKLFSLDFIGWHGQINCFPGFHWLSWPGWVKRTNKLFSLDFLTRVNPVKLVKRTNKLFSLDFIGQINCFAGFSLAILGETDK